GLDRRTVRPARETAVGTCVLPMILGTDFFGRGLTCRAAVSELSRSVLPPAPEGSVGLDRQRVFPSRVDALPVIVGAYLFRAQTTEFVEVARLAARGAVAQFAESVLSPCPERAICLDREAEDRPGTDAAPIGVVADLLWARIADAAAVGAGSGV